MLQIRATPTIATRLHHANSYYKFSQANSSFANSEHKINIMATSGSRSPTPTQRDSTVGSEFGSFDIGDTQVQMSGMLVKKPFGGKKGKKGSWQKR